MVDRGIKFFKPGTLSFGSDPYRGGSKRWGQMYLVLSSQSGSSYFKEHTRMQGFIKNQSLTVVDSSFTNNFHTEKGGHSPSFGHTRNQPLQSFNRQ